MKGDPFGALHDAFGYGKWKRRSQNVNEKLLKRWKLAENLKSTNNCYSWIKLRVKWKMMKQIAKMVNNIGTLITQLFRL